MSKQGPEMLGKYQLIEELGRGAFATVFRALDTTLDREVALKILHPPLLTDPSFVDRFKREARAMANLDHQHIATVYEVGEAEGRVYIAMQLARGPDLGESLGAEGCFSWERTLDLLRPVCEALDYAHVRGVVHRDLKPSNVLLDAERGPLLTDFGFARLMGDSSVSLSLSGGILGTPAYIAPEVWELDAAEPAADVYALGCLLYEMLTGEVLFAGKTPMQAMRAHDQGAQLPREWPEDVPEGIETVLEKALARDPRERYPSGMALWHALNDLEAQAQAAQEALQQAAVAAQWREETEAAMAAEEWSVAKMAAARWLAVAPDDPDAQEAQAEIERQLKGPPVDEEEDKKEKKESKKKEEEEEEEPDQEGEPTIPTSVPSGPKVPVWAWALGVVALLALVIYLAGAPGMSGNPTPEIIEKVVTVERERFVTATPEIVEKVVIATSTSTPRPSATPPKTPFPTSTSTVTPPPPTSTPRPTTAPHSLTATPIPEEVSTSPAASTQSLLPCWGRTSVIPGIGDTVFGKDPITLSWRKDFDLPSGYHFEIVLVHDSGEPVLIQTSDSYQTTFAPLPEEKHGGWSWRIYVKTSTGEYAKCDGDMMIFDGRKEESSKSECLYYSGPQGDGCKIGGFRYSFWYQPNP